VDLLERRERVRDVHPAALGGRGDGADDHDRPCRTEPGRVAVQHGLGRLDDRGPDAGNNTSTAVTSVTASADLAITKSGP